MKLILYSLLIVCSFLGTAHATPASLTLNGKIVLSDGTPLQYNNVSFVFNIVDPSGSCLIYSEQVGGYNMSSSGGAFEVPVGAGTVKYPLSGTFSILAAFNNTLSFACGTCGMVNGSSSCSDGSSTYTATVGDGRRLRVQFYDGSGWQTISPDLNIRSVPFAGYAASAEKLGNNIANDFLLKAGLPTCSPGTFLSWDGANLSCANVNTGLVGGDLTGSIGAAKVVALQSHPVDPIAPTSNQVLLFNGTKWTPTTLPTGFIGTGNAGYVPYFSTSSSLASSSIYVSGGSVGIGTATPSMALDVVGNIRTSGCLYYAASSLGICASDERLKKEVKPFDLGLKAILGLNPVNFKYNGLAGFENDDKIQLGVIAQDVEKAAPELVERQNVNLHPNDKEKTEIKVVNYGAFTYVLINSVKELYRHWFDDSRNLHREMAYMKAENASRDRELVELKAKAEKQKQENEALKTRLDKQSVDLVILKQKLGI